MYIRHTTDLVIMVMLDNPESLEEVCLEVVCDSVAASLGRVGPTLVSPGFEVLKPVPPAVSDRILRKLSEKDSVTSTNLSYFSPENARLKNVYIENSVITEDSLKV